MAVSSSRRVAITGIACDAPPDTNVLSRRQIEWIKNLTDEELTRTQDNPTLSDNPLNKILALNAEEQKDRSSYIEINKHSYNVSLKFYVGYHFLLLSHVAFFQAQLGKMFDSQQVDKWYQTLNNSLVPLTNTKSHLFHGEGRIDRGEQFTKCRNSKKYGVQYTYTLKQDDTKGMGYHGLQIVSYFNPDSCPPRTVAPHPQTSSRWSFKGLFGSDYV